MLRAWFTKNLRSPEMVLSRPSLSLLNFRKHLTAGRALQMFRGQAWMWDWVTWCSHWEIRPHFAEVETGDQKASVTCWLVEPVMGWQWGPWKIPALPSQFEIPAQEMPATSFPDRGGLLYNMPNLSMALHFGLEYLQVWLSSSLWKSSVLSFPGKFNSEGGLSQKKLGTGERG